MVQGVEKSVIDSVNMFKHLLQRMDFSVVVVVVICSILAITYY